MFTPRCSVHREVEALHDSRNLIPPPATKGNPLGITIGLFLHAAIICFIIAQDDVKASCKCIFQGPSIPASWYWHLHHFSTQVLLIPRLVSFYDGDVNLACSHRFQPRNSPAALRRRRALIIRLAIVLGVALLFSIFVWPGVSMVPILSLGLLSSGEDFQLETVRYYDLSNVQGTARGWEREERILLCAPLRDAESHLPMFFSHLRNLTYPHHLIDLAFLVSDSKDRTLALLSELLEALQADEDAKQPYGEISIIEKDFGQKVNQDVESRHGFAAQASRRKLMAQARNWLLSAALRPYHSWVYWRDVDVETAPFTILEDLMRHNKDVIVPSKCPP